MFGTHFFVMMCLENWASSAGWNMCLKMFCYSLDLPPGKFWECVLFAGIKLTFKAFLPQFRVLNWKYRPPLKISFYFFLYERQLIKSNEIRSLCLEVIRKWVDIVKRSSKDVILGHLDAKKLKTKQKQNCVQIMTTLKKCNPLIQI